MANIPRTFSHPPLGEKLTIDQLYDWHRVHSPKATAFVFPKSTNHYDQTTLTWKELGEGVIKGTEIIQQHIPEIQDNGNKSQKRDPLVVGILSTADSITYTTFLISHMRLTHPRTAGRAILPFPISPGNSVAAVAHLVRATGAKHLWVTQGPMMTMAEEAQHQGLLEDTTILPFPTFSELYASTASAPSSSYSTLPRDNIPVPLDQPALVLHSSGSTAFPKPRTITHQMLLECLYSIECAGLKVKDEIMAVHSSPMFHALGIYTACWPAVSGFIRAVTSPGVSQPPLTPELFLQYIVNSNSTFLICVPSFLEAWSTEPSSLKEIKLKTIFWGGGPLGGDTGRFLHDEGVRIYTIYGATECGPLSLLPVRPHPEGYEWFEFMPHIKPEFIRDANTDSYEIVLKESEKHHLAVHNTQVDGIPAYATNDLVERHQSNPNLFRILGRTDDQIMFSTGEKTNPGPLESIINNNPHVKDAIMFGRSRLSNGIIIEPSSFEDAKKLGVEKFRSLIWPSIEAANKFSPAHSRIFKEMILVSSPSKPFSYTVKKTPRRGLILRDYAEEIEGIYKAVEDTSSTQVPIPSGSSSDGGWTQEESLKFVRDVVHSIMTGSKSIGDDDDLFGCGCDSLQSTYIRNTLLHALRQVAPPANVLKVPSNVVYQHPTITQLATVAARAARPQTTSVDFNGVDFSGEEVRKRCLLEFVAKYTQDWPMHTPTGNAVAPKDETILLTGSTGGLGSQLLAQLVAMPSVSRIFAFNRPSKKSSRKRHLEAFLDRGNNIELLDSEKIVYVEGDTAVKGFNIEPKLFAQIRNSVTTIIHNAWRVDFNISLSSFEPAVQGLRHMIDLALQSPHPSPPRVMFTSSVGNVKAWSDIPPVAEAPFTDLAHINPSGYSESKWVSERILSIAGQFTPLRPVIIRVGQLCGGMNGNWNSREWFPSLVRAGQVVGGLPNNQGLVSFVPLHVAASAIIELRNTSSEFAHIVHPRPVTWEAVIGHVSNALGVPVIPYNEWLSRVEALPKTDEALHLNPALHLTNFYRVSAAPKDISGLKVQEREAMGLAMYETTRTAADAPSFGVSRLAQLGREDVESWIGYWKMKRVLDV